MKVRNAAVLALALALLGTTVSGTAFARPRVPADLSGTWLMDRARSDGPEGRGHDRWNRRDRGDFQGRSDYQNSGDRGEFRGRPAMNAALLPELIRIDQRRHVVRITDSRNRVLEEIAITNRFPRNRDDRNFVVGEWRGSKLEVERTGPFGGRITQTFALVDRGRTLLVRTRQEGRGPRPAVEFTSVYHKA